MILARDLNARVGNCNVCDTVLDIVDYNEYSPELPPDRASQENTSYPRGLQLINLCKATSLKLQDTIFLQEKYFSMIT